MVNPRFIPVMLAISLGSVLVGCSKSTSLEPGPPAGGENGEVVTEVSGEDGRESPWWRDESILAELRLTDDQIQAIKEFVELARQEGSQLRQQERRLTVNYLRALAQEPYDPELVDRVGGRLIEVLSSKNRRRIETVRALRDILTQEQWTKLWEVAPGIIQIGGFRVLRGPKITVTDEDLNASPSPTP